MPTSYFFKGESFIAIFKINNSAVLKSVSGKTLLHGYIIPVGVDFNVREDFEALVKAEINDSASVVFYGDAVDDGVGRII